MALNVATITDLVAKNGVEALISVDAVIPVMDKEIAREYEQRNYQTGATVNVRIENQPAMPQQSSVAIFDPIVQGQISVTVLQWMNAIMMGGVEEAYYYGGEERVKTRILKPYSETMATQAAIICYNELVTCPGFVGTPGTGLKTATDFGLGRAALNEQLANNSGLYCFMSPSDMADVAGDLATKFNPTKESATAYMDGMVKEAVGINFVETSNIPNHTNGTAAGTGAAGMALSATSLTGATTLAVSGGTSAGTITLGSVIWVAGVYEVQPHTKNTLSRLRTFTVTELCTLSGGAGTIKVSPAIYGPENPKLQTCSRLPTSGSYVGIKGAAGATYSQMIFMKKNSSAFIGLSLPDLIKCEVASAEYEGVEVKATAVGDFTNYNNYMRQDILVAAKNTQWRHQYRAFNRLLT